MRLSGTKSSFNSETSKVFESQLSRSWAFVEKFAADNVEGDNIIFGLDINKCRKNETYFNEYDYPQFTVMDKVQNYTGDNSKPGLYYVETKSYFPLRGNGWYNQPMIQYCLEKEIITTCQVKYVIYSSLKVKHDHFNKLINYYQELNQYNTTDFKVDKFSVNTMIGAFEPKSRENWQSVGITDNLNHAFYEYLKNEKRDIDCINVADKHFWHIYDKRMLSVEETEAPIYNMILELEAIELHKLTELVKSKGGEVLDVCTDCVNCTFENNVLPFELDGINVVGSDFAKGVPKYKVEEKEGRLRVEMMKKHIRNDKYLYEKKEWKVIEDTQEFDAYVKHILDSNLSINIDGLAGTGKSYLTKKLQQKMEEAELKFVSLATSNKAARLIHGMTIHIFIKKHPPKIIRELNLDYIIVDEISMMHEMFYNYLLVLMKLKPNLGFILVGNFDQLLPVKDRVEVDDYENSVALHDLCMGNRLKLTKCRRADDTTFKMVSPDNIPNLKPSDFNDDFTTRHLAFTNKKRIEINNKMMDEVAAKKAGKKNTTNV